MLLDGFEFNAEHDLRNLLHLGVHAVRFDLVEVVLHHLLVELDALLVVLNPLLLHSDLLPQLHSFIHCFQELSLPFKLSILLLRLQFAL